MNPLTLATEGFLDSPLSIVTGGYIYQATVVDGGGNSRVITGRNKTELERQLREDEEILEIVMVAIQQGII
jgi:hypothetical protein